MILSTVALFALLVANGNALVAPGKRAPTGCDLSNAEMTLPEGQTSLVQPDAAPSYLVLGVGTQNYTCSAAGTFMNVGALAELFDISCLYDTPVFPYIPDVVSAIWQALPPAITPAEMIEFLHLNPTPVVVGEHYYVPNPITNNGTVPTWDFTSHLYNGNPDAYVDATRAAGIPAPTGSQDIDWVYLTQIQGSLADEVFRTDTRLGQPPASCTPGSGDITVKYVAKYWLYGGSISA